MAENDTLLAYLVPKHVRSPEDAATDALVYILNKSKSAADGFNSLISGSIGEVEHCTVFTSQVTEGRSRFDLVGFDANGRKRVIGESKFWASLGEGQGSGYLVQLDSDGIAVLLFIVPDARIDYLWKEVMDDVMRGDKGTEFEAITANGRTRYASVKDSDKRLMMLSWREVLAKIHDYSDGEPSVQADIRQLQGLADRMDSEAFLPLSREELSSDFARRTSHFPKLVNDAVDRGINEGWLNVDGLRLAYQEYGYGRYIRISQSVVWFGINIYQWGSNSETPLWINLVNRNLKRMLEDSPEGFRITLFEDFAGLWTPIHLPVRVDREEVLDCVVSQLQAIADAILSAKLGHA